MIPISRTNKSSFLDKIAVEFDNEDQLKEYLKKHPKADPKKHTVKKKDDKTKSDDSSKKDLKKKVEEKKKELSSEQISLGKKLIETFENAETLSIKEVLPEMDSEDHNKVIKDLGNTLKKEFGKKVKSLNTEVDDIDYLDDDGEDKFKKLNWETISSAGQKDEPGEYNANDYTEVSKSTVDGQTVYKLHVQEGSPAGYQEQTYFLGI